MQTIVTTLAHRYGTSDAFCARYINNQLGELSEATDPVAFEQALSPTQRLYLEYALSTNLRGRDLARLYPRTTRHARILDIGCGYGGTIRAFAEAGYEALGLEIDPNLAEFARLNIEHISNARVMCSDFVTEDPAALGSFDLIFCTDVIEHVSNPDRALEVAASLLRASGLLVLQIPNRNSVRQVLSDGHFCLFGSTLLSRQEGRELKRQIQGWDDPYHHMGELMPLAYYTSRLRQHGLTVHVAESDIESSADVLTMFGDCCKRLAESQSDSRLSWFTRRELAQAFSEYGKSLFESYSSAMQTGELDSFFLRYAAPTWAVTARRD